MSRNPQRVQLARAYVLHQRPFRDSSLIVEMFAREHGRMTVFARAARGPRTRYATLQPFRALLLSWSGRGEAPQLTGAEVADASPPLPPARLMSAFYLNELLLKLTTRHDPHLELFDLYETTLAQLSHGASAEVPLRQFEARLLDYIGYGLDLAAEADTGRPVRAEGYYHFRAGVHGVVIAQTDDGVAGAAGIAGDARGANPGGAIAGRVLQALATGAPIEDEAQLRQARALMRAALDHCLEGRELNTRSVARALSHYPRRERRV